MTRSPIRWGVVLLAVTLSLAPTRTASADEKAAAAAAREHFALGVALADRGEISAAAVEFRRAYELRPHPAVLFNLGRAYSALGRHADAVRTLRRYLHESIGLEPARRAQVEGLLAFAGARVGSLELTIEPRGAEVFLDGTSLGNAPFTEALELDAGAHGVLVIAPSHVSSFQTVNVTPKERVRLSVALDPAPPAEQGQLTASCRVPGASVVVDGVSLGTTPLAPLLVPAGRRSVSFVRDGYSRSEHEVVVPARGEGSVECSMRLESKVTGPTGRLRVRGLPPGARISVNGEPYTGRPLPAGPHELTVEHPDYELWRSSLRLVPGGNAVIDARLRSSLAAQHREQSARSRKQRVWAALTGGAGVLLTASAATAYKVNTARVDRWNAANKDVTSTLASGSTTPEVLERNRQLQDDAASIQRTDDLALGLAVSGGVAISVAVWLWLTAEDSAPSRRGLALTSPRPTLRFAW